MTGEMTAIAKADFAVALRQLLDLRTLVVISSDFTHYGRDFDYVPFTDDVQARLQALDKGMFEKLPANDNRIWSVVSSRAAAAARAMPSQTWTTDGR